MSKKDLPILVTGSLAYDYIMDFPGYFSEHILPDKIHRLNLSFGLGKMTKNFGGTAGNIAYTLRLLDSKVFIIGSGGNDFSDYLSWLKKNKIGLVGLSLTKKFSTAAAYIMTDLADNQITGFYAGAMNLQPVWPKIQTVKFLGIIAPDKADKMIYYSRQFQIKKIEYIFDPGQAVTSLNKKQILGLLKNSKLLIANDYEAELMFRKINSSLPAWQKILPIIVTYGPQGSKIFYQNKQIKINAVKVKQSVDPTGAGDAYRAGLLSGLSRKYDLITSAKFGATAASFAVEYYGTQVHSFTFSEFRRRLQKNFKISL